MGGLAVRGRPGADMLPDLGKVGSAAPAVVFGAGPVPLLGLLVAIHGRSHAAHEQDRQQKLEFFAALAITSRGFPSVNQLRLDNNSRPLGQ